MNDELQSMLEEVIMACFKELSWHLAMENEEIKKMPHLGWLVPYN
jgi:hypothetical protein